MRVRASMHACVCTHVSSVEVPGGVRTEADPLLGWLWGPRAAPGWQGAAMGPQRCLHSGPKLPWGHAAISWWAPR